MVNNDLSGVSFEQISEEISEEKPEETPEQSVENLSIHSIHSIYSTHGSSEELIDDNSESIHSSEEVISIKDEQEESYKIKGVLCYSLQRTTGMESSTVMEQMISIDDYAPPSEHGLSNCNIIIPNYYHKNYQKIIDIDYYNMIIDDIRNFRKLNSYQFDFIRQLEDVDKMRIIHEFNECSEVISSIIDDK